MKKKRLSFKKEVISDLSLKSFTGGQTEFTKNNYCPPPSHPIICKKESIEIPCDSTNGQKCIW
ncbi:MAG: hypothetical protein ACEPOV_14220 [Hyphomicrobiales bacterium]